MITEETIEQIRRGEVGIKYSERYYWDVVTILENEYNITNFNLASNKSKTGINCEDLFNYLIKNKKP